MPGAISACLIASAMPVANSWSGSVCNVVVSQTTARGWWNAPTRFFPSGRSIAVLPPIAESIWPSSVVGICTSGTPRWYVAAAKPAASPTTPPPSAATTSVRCIPTAASQRHIDSSVTVLFDDSPGSSVNCSTRRPVVAKPLRARSPCNPATEASVTSAIVSAFGASTSSPARASRSGPIQIVYDREPRSTRSSCGSLTARASRCRPPRRRTSARRCRR